MSRDERYRWRLRRVTLAVSAVLALVFGVGCWALLHETGDIRGLATDIRQNLIPSILDRQRAVVGLERLKQDGAAVLESAEAQVRAESVLLFSHAANHPALQADPTMAAVVGRAEQAVIALARARDRGDQLRRLGQTDAADAAERDAREDWREAEKALDRMSESLFVGTGDLGGARAQTFDRVAAHVEAMLVGCYVLLLLALVGTGLLAVQFLLRPILLTTAALEANQTNGPVSLPVSSIREIDLFYRSVERIAKALSEIEEANRQARTAQAELRRLASVDELTGVANRRWFTAMASRELERCRRFNHQLALVMLDIDHFKRVNDTHGHAVGDEVLKAFTRVIEANLRSIDLFGRLGGEEFAIVLPETERDAAHQTAERLRAAVEKMALPFVDGTQLTITTSLGIAILQGGGDTLDSILARADGALYAAKREGRNRVVVSAA